MKAVLLVRVSTEGQDYEAQTHDLKNYAASLGFTNLHIIQDKESAVKLTEEQRNGLNEMKSYLLANSDCKDVFIWEISRLARTEKVLHSIKEWLVNAGIQLHIFDKRIKLLNEDGSENPNTALIFSILGSFASQEAKTMKARFKRGKVRSKELGKYTGGKLKYGYYVDEEKKFQINVEQAEVVKLIFKLYATGKYSVNKLTEELQARGIKIYSRAVMSILQDNSYTGESHMHYTPIVSKELFQIVAEVRKNNNSNFTKVTDYDRVAFGRKLMKCDSCGHHYTVVYAKSGASYACAYSGHRYESPSNPQQRCRNTTYFNRDWLDCLLWYIARPMHEQRLKRINKEDAKRIGEEIDIIEKKQRVLLEKIQRINERKARAVEAYIDGLISSDQKDAKISQINHSNHEMMEEITNLDERRNNLVKMHRIALGIDSPNVTIKKDYSLEDMDAIVKENITSITLSRFGDKYYKVEITPITGDVMEWYFKKFARVGTKWNDSNFQPKDDEILPATSDYWELRKKESN